MHTEKVALPNKGKVKTKELTYIGNGIHQHGEKLYFYCTNALKWKRLKPEHVNKKRMIHEGDVFRTEGRGTLFICKRVLPPITSKGGKVIEGHTLDEKGRIQQLEEHCLTV